MGPLSPRKLIKRVVAIVVQTVLIKLLPINKVPMTVFYFFLRTSKTVF